uniref:Endonuclease/exonuclease/phosphatase family protein n=1 Tax=Marseillevirus LCMAC102 TaxID=2506603 RepID=A0A481YV85_9VIRU|nr:MAG: endonuclease/exonuclease/phosphatase family protein [Marseillevirus LCMAC102]
MDIDLLVDVLRQRIDSSLTYNLITHSLHTIAQLYNISEEEMYGMIIALLDANYCYSTPNVWNETFENTSTTDFLNSYKTDLKICKTFNHLIPQKSQNVIRFMTYNVHFWTDPSGKKTFDKFVTHIKNLQPDIIGLQEVLIPGPHSRHSHSSLGWSIKNTFSPLYKMGYKIKSCGASKTASLGQTSFGNVLASSLPIVSSDFFILDTPQEPRCVIIGEIKLPDGQNILIVIVHLDVYDLTGKTRRRQLKMVFERIDSYGNLPTIIMGDFNSLKYDDYSFSEKEWLKRNSQGNVDYETIEMLKTKGFQDVFERPLKYTVWTGRRVDYIFGRNFPYKVSGTYIYYSDSSDHLPLIADINLEK